MAFCLGETLRRSAFLLKTSPSSHFFSRLPFFCLPFAFGFGPDFLSLVSLSLSLSLSLSSDGLSNASEMPVEIGMRRNLLDRPKPKRNLDD